MNIRKKQGLRQVLWATIGVTILLVSTVLLCVNHSRSRMRESSFEELIESTKHLVRDFQNIIDTDRTILTATADLISTHERSDTEAIASFMRYVSGNSLFIEQAVLLTPDNQLLDQDGNWTDVSGQIDFEEEAEKGSYISERRTDILQPDLLAVYHAVPVIQNGTTEAILYGVLMLDQLSDAYELDLYDGNGLVVIADGSTGEVVLDTWHDSLGKMSDFFDRDMLIGSFSEAEQNIQNGISGDLAFISKTIGSTLYLHYEPMGVNNWSVFLGVTEEEALAGARASMKSLYLMAAVITLALFVYLAVIVRFLFCVNRDIYRMGIVDPCTGMLNRNAYEAFLQKNHSVCFDKITCIFVDANGLHEINNQYGHDAGDLFLQTIANRLRQQWPDEEMYRIGGDEFVVFPQEKEKECCQQAVDRLQEALARDHYSISVGLSCREMEIGLDGVVQEADDRMLENKKAYYRKHDRRKAR